MFNQIFLIKLMKIIFVSFLMGLFFTYLITIFEKQLVYEYDFKSLFMILSVILCVIFYLMGSFFFKALNFKDLKLKY